MKGDWYICKREGPRLAIQFKWQHPFNGFRGWLKRFWVFKAWRMKGERPSQPTWIGIRVLGFTLEAYLKKQRRT